MPFPDIDPILFQIGPLAIRWYALAYIAGLILGWRYIVALIREKALWYKEPPATRLQIDDLLLWATLGVIVGGRLGYVLFYQPAHYLTHPLEIAAVWQGGMSFHGGILGVAAAIVLFARRQNINMFALGDLVAAAAPIGLFFGRIANFINGELWGRPTDVPWGVIFPYRDAGPYPRHPSQLYEAGLEGLILFVALRYLTHKTDALSRPGTISGAFLAGYGLSRFFVEFFREPDSFLGYFGGVFTMGMMLSLPMIAAGAGLIWWAREQAAGEAKRATSKKPAKKRT